MELAISLNGPIDVRSIFLVKGVNGDKYSFNAKLSCDTLCSDAGSIPQSNF